MTHGLNDSGPGRGNRGHRRKQVPAQTEALFDAHGRPKDHGAEGRQRRDDGTKLAEHGATAIARRAGEDGIRRLAERGDPFTADTLHALLEREGGPTLPSKLVGALFLNASRGGIIEPVGWATSERPSRHGGPQRVWTGVDA